MISQPGRLIFCGLVVGFSILAIELATEPSLAIVWDEGYTIGREARLRAWFSALRDPPGFARRWTPPTPEQELVQQEGALVPRPDELDTRAKLLFDSGVLNYFWPFAREEPHGHPPFYALLGLLGDLLAPTWQDLPRARLGPMLLFSVTAGLLFWFASKRWGTLAGIGSAAALVFQPNLFGHSHYATYDAILTALWLLAIMAFAEAVNLTEKEQSQDRDDWGWLAAIFFGVIVGCALATKLTGWFLPLPFLAWTIWNRDRRGALTLAVGLPLAVGILVLLNPPWWTDPITGLARFLRSNLTRGETIPIPVQFLGVIYETPRQSLPWYNTLVWTVLVTPIGFLLLAGAGIVRAIRLNSRERLGPLIFGHWLLLIGLRALPHTPGHDGVRLFLPAFGVLSMLVGLGTRELRDRLGPRGRLAVAAAVFEGFLSVLLFLPVPLSYFSPLVGGLPGARRLGMEPTFYWDGLSAEARAWLREHTPPGQSISFATFPTSWLYLRRVGELPPRIYPVDPGRPTWYVLQNRPGAWSQPHRRLAEEGHPAFVVRKFDVPLVWIFPYDDLEEVMRRLSGEELR
ncbi:MAG: ArnT family glycosyltransferase [Isosphaeraceae bacterium]